MYYKNPEVDRENPRELTFEVASGRKVVTDFSIRYMEKVVGPIDEIHAISPQAPQIVAASPELDSERPATDQSKQVENGQLLASAHELLDEAFRQEAA